MMSVLTMRFLRILGSTLTIATGVVGIVGQSAPAVELRDGTLWFDRAPRLVAATTTFDNVDVWGATYYFTINLPPKAGEPLKRVVINQIEGLDDIEYQLKDTSAFEGMPRSKGKKVTLGEVTMNQEKRTISVTFDPPVQPGTTVTVGLVPVRNPLTDGVYLFGVTTFPAGEERRNGLYLGVGRLQFYRRF